MKLSCFFFGAVLVLFAILNVLGTAIDAQKEAITPKVGAIQNYRSSKNIMFSATFGGSSHVVWVLSILNELSSRGHSTFFVTRDDHVKFANDYPSISVHSIGKGRDSSLGKQIVQQLRDQPGVQSMKNLFYQLMIIFKEDYIPIRDFIDTNDIDIGICDTFNDPCVEACLTAGIPFILSSTFSIGKDSGAPYINNDMLTMRHPTTELMSLKERLHDMIIKPIQMMFLMKDTIARHNQVLMSLGITPAATPEDKWVDSVKIVNTAFGFEQGRPVGPLVEFVGPIVPPTNYPALTSKIEQFLSTRQRVAYGAFGQHAWPTEEDGNLILTALFEALESGDIDGIIWATRGIKDMFPDFVTTSSNTTYNIHSFYNNATSPVLLLDWAPQVAIINHPSTSIFITHVGAGSLYEAMHAGIRIVTYPFFGDQPATSATATKNGIGLHLDCKKSQQDANEVIHRVARDENGDFQAAVTRFKAIVQIKSKSGMIRGADVVEEVLFTQVKGKIPHRYDVKRDISFVKANNLDIYAFLLTSFACVGYVIWIIISHIITAFSSSVSNKKLKSL